MNRTVLHINITHFYVSVTCLQTPRLRGYPVAVAAPGTRRTILGISSEAWRAGIARGMMVDAAQRICPDLVLLDPVPNLYEKVENSLFDQACRLSPQVEHAGPGHLFIDLTGTERLLGGVADVAERFRRNIRERYRIEPVIGVGANRLVSKVATRVIKPNGFCTVIPGCEQEFMAPLPLNLLPGVEIRIIEQLLQFNLHLVRDLLRIPSGTLATAIGPSAFTIAQLAKGIDTTLVSAVGTPEPTVTESLVLAEQTNCKETLSAALFHLVVRAMVKVRAMGLSVGKVALRIRYADGATVVRFVMVHPPISGDLSLHEFILPVFRKSITRRVRLTELRIVCSDLTFPYGQIDLFAQTQREEHLMSALDRIRSSFGREAIRFWGRERIA